MAQSQPSSSVLSLWALTRFPNYPGEVHVVNTKELFVRVNNQLVAFQPKNVADFKENEPYVCKTSINSLDGNSHPYSVQIGKLSESKSELDAICLNLKEKTSAESNRFRWKNIKNFPVDPESSGAEDQAGMEVLSSTAAEKKLNQRKRRHNENEELQKFILTSKVVAANQSSSSLEASKVVAANQSSSSLEEEYRKTLEKLEQELKEKEKLAREKEELARKSEMLAREKADLARQLKERSTNISPSVQELVKGMQHELKEVLSKQQEQNLRLFEEYKNKLSQEIAEEMKRYREELGQSSTLPLLLFDRVQDWIL
ncbi:Protein FAM117A [Frankliniella fusca]|uniref:Protein FAM117A n=1 Tax=Frankliniella fusca TaxID=407009 RepID=A0AAE1HNS0_9NEOP|nr:Protein FAM117A [Frankliniella fusca]